MPKLSAAQLREQFDIVSEIADARLNPCLKAAERTLRSLVTDAVYDAETPTAQVEGLEFAEGLFAVYHLLLNTGLRIRRAGLVKQEQNAGGSVTNNVINEYYTPKEILDLRKQFLADANDAASPYQPVPTIKRQNTSILISGGWAE